MFKRILVPLDGSRFSGRALRYAIEVAQHFGSEVFLIQVVPPTPLAVVAAPPDGMGSPAVTEMTIQEARRQDKSNETRASRYLRSKLKTVTAHNLKGSIHAVTGTPTKSIMDLCHKKNVGLIIMTTHGKSGIRRALVGSVTDVIIRESGVPVLVIRPQPKKRQK